MAKRNQIWHEKNGDRVRKKAKERARKDRQKILEHYSFGFKACRCCGEANERFLSLDHIHNNGAEDRKKIGSGMAFYRWLIRNNFPDGFQLLCFNCNIGKGIYGVCPHKLKETK